MAFTSTLVGDESMFPGAVIWEREAFSFTSRKIRTTT